uniref:Uncharacterized protein n=1 Tax=Branchiostoma floridae TaxID=7739 RepID=C3ZSW7_BRAFL|eukprot:XP_002588301.1 hypothetical protein BRAFLDRAFT_81433 [Branchiostoma floridae]
MAASSKPCVPAWLVNPTPVGNYSIFSVVGKFPYPFSEGRRYRRLVLGQLRLEQFERTQRKHGELHALQLDGEKWYNDEKSSAAKAYSENTDFRVLMFQMDSDETRYFSEKFYTETTCYNYNQTAMVPMAQEYYTDTTHCYNSHTAMAQEFCMEATYYNNPTAMDPMAQGYYMDTPYYYSNPTDMAQGYNMETPYCYYSNPTAMVSMTQEHAYTDMPWYNGYNHTATVQMAQDYYTETPTYSNNSTTVVPLTQEWVSRLRSNVDDGYGSALIMEKFLTGISECERETPAYMDDSAHECTPGVSQNEVRWSSQSSSKSGQTTRSEMTQLKVAPGDIGQNFSDDNVTSPVCLSQYDKHDGDIKGPKELQEADLINNLDIDDWIMLLGSEAGTLYYSEDEEEMSEMTRDSVGGPDGDSMEEKQAFPTSSVPCRLINELSDSTAQEIQLLDQSESDRSSDDLKEIKLLNPIELVCQSYGMEDLVEIQLLDFAELDHQSDSSSEYPEEIQLLTPFELDHHSDCGSEDQEEIQLLDPFELDHQSVRSSEDPEEIRLLDVMELDHQSVETDGTEETYQLLDPIEMLVPCVWQNSVPQHRVVITNRLSRYELFHGPTHRVRSPSCPLIGARGDSRERSVYSDDTEVRVSSKFNC